MLNDLDDRRLKRANEDVNLDWMTGQRVNKKSRFLLPALGLLALLVFLFIAYQFWRVNNSGKMTPLNYLAEPSSQSSLAEEKQLVIDASVKVTAVEHVGAQNKLDNNEQLTIHNDEDLELPVSKQLGENVTMNAAVDKAIMLIDKKPVKEVATVNLEVKRGASRFHDVKNIEPAQSIRNTRVLTVQQTDKKIASEAKSLLRAGKISAAENKLRSYLDDNPQASSSGQLLASVFLSTKQFSNAETLIEQLRKASPDNIALISNQARVYLQTNRVSQAVDLLMMSKPSLDNNTAYYELLGLAARQNKQYQLSLQAYRGLLNVDSSRGDWWVGMAIALDQGGELSQAREAYRQGINSSDLTTTLRQYAQQRLAVI
jgi:MSHA biogenesis protein MshN